jgi:uncharacterized protein YjdB
LLPGKARVHVASRNGRTQTDFQVTVSARVIAVTGLTADDLVLGPKDGPQTPGLHWQPKDADDREYTLASLDSAIAVPFAGKVKPLAPGKAVFIATSHDGGFAARFQVQVQPDSATLVSIAAKDFRLDLRDPPYVPVISFTPSDATDKSYTLTAPEAGGAIRVEGDKVLPVRTGKSPLRIVPHGNPSAAVVCSVTVTAKVRSISAKNDTLLLGRDLKSAAKLLTWDPPEATSRSFRLVSQDTGIVRIGAGRASYQGVAAGSAQVIVQALDGSGAADTFTVTVVIPVNSLTFDPPTALTLRLGGPDYRPGIITAPANATVKSWHLVSSNPAVATVADGVTIHAVSLGGITVQAVADDNPQITATLEVQVLAGPEAAGSGPPAGEVHRAAVAAGMAMPGGAGARVGPLTSQVTCPGSCSGFHGSLPLSASRERSLRARVFSQGRPFPDKRRPCACPRKDA